MIESSAQYHRLTNYQRHNMGGHYLDWGNQPIVYKDYPGLPPFLLPSPGRIPEEKLSSIFTRGEMGTSARALSVDDLTLILRLSYSITAKARYGGGDFYFRSVASAGALYPTELYVAAHGVERLEDGLYHFAIHRNVLYPVRSQDLSHHVLELIQGPGDKVPVLTFFLTAIFFRSAWKYRERSYRYDLLDTGHLVENLTLALKALHLPFHIHYDFDDARVNHLLGLDQEKEVALAVVVVSGDKSVAHGSVQEMEQLPERIRQASRVSGGETDYPVIREMHRAGGSIMDQKGQGPDRTLELGVTPKGWEKNLCLSPWPEVISYPNAVFRRRSGRNFVKDPIGKDCLTALIESLCQKDEAHSPEEGVFQESLSPGLLVGSAEGMEPGLYLLDVKSKSIGPFSLGSFTKRMAQVCLDQAWLAHAAVHFLFLTNLDVLDRIWGPRGYRYAMMTAGRMGERLYIGATAMGIGCCGIGAFYDQEAAELIGLNKASYLLYLVAVGPVKSLQKSSY